jgi:hypothetical protein
MQNKDKVEHLSDHGFRKTFGRKVVESTEGNLKWH